MFERDAKLAEKGWVFQEPVAEALHVLNSKQSWVSISCALLITPHALHHYAVMSSAYSPMAQVVDSRHLASSQLVEAEASS